MAVHGGGFLLQLQAPTPTPHPPTPVLAGSLFNGAIFSERCNNLLCKHGVCSHSISLHIERSLRQAEQGEQHSPFPPAGASPGGLVVVVHVTGLSNSILSSRLPGSLFEELRVTVSFTNLYRGAVFIVRMETREEKGKQLCSRVAGAAALPAQSPLFPAPSVRCKRDA